VYQHLPIAFVLIFLQYPRQCNGWSFYSCSPFSHSAVVSVSPRLQSESSSSINNVLDVPVDDLYSSSEIRRVPKQEKVEADNNGSSLSTSSSSSSNSNNSQRRQQRRRQLKLTEVITVGILSSFLFVGSPQQQPYGLLQPPAAIAFDNGIPEMKNYNNIPKHPGTTPTTLGIDPTTGKLALCEEGALNCFSTTGNDSDFYLLQPWIPKNRDISKTQATKQLVETIKAYPPGQNRVDKGGFRIISSKPGEYLYIQFASMKHGFIDDVEFAISDNNDNGDSSTPFDIQVRSASRIGFLDLGVNGKRLNWISNHLVDTYGWTRQSDNPPITPASYPDYFPMMPFSFDDYIRSVLSPESCPVPANPLECNDPASGPA